MVIKAKPPPRNISRLFSEIADLKSKTLPARPMNNTMTPIITLSKLVLVISGWKNPESNAKNAIR